LLDLNLPKKDGREVLAELKESPVLKSIPVVILTTSASEADIQGSYQRHANCYITKPVDLEGFLKVVRSIDSEMMTSESRSPLEVPAVVLDRTQFDHLCELQGSDHEFIHNLIDLFLAEMPRRLAEMRAARARNDWRMLAHVAHTMQGVAANVGARAFALHCQKIEAAARAVRLAEMDVLMSGLDDELARLAAMLEKQKQRVSLENPDR